MFGTLCNISERDQVKSTTSNERTSEEQPHEAGLQKEAVKRSKSAVEEEEEGEQKVKKVAKKEPSALNSSFEASIKGLEEDLLKIPGTQELSQNIPNHDLGSPPGIKEYPLEPPKLEAVYNIPKR